MKKYFLLASTLLLFAACQNNDENSQNSSTKEKTVETSQTNADSQQTSETISNDNQVNKSQNQTSDNIAMTELQAHYPRERFPMITSVDPTEEIAIAVGEEENTLTVSYYLVDKQIPLNDPLLSNATPIGQFQRILHNTTEEAKNDVAPNTDAGGQAIDLGHNIIGHQQSGAGSTYLNWQEGNWSMAIQANNLEGEDPQPLAKEIVEYLEKAFLPAPKDVGSGSFMINSSDYHSNVVAWQEGTTVYKISNENTMNSLKMAVSMNQ
ncbi:hypothetical protein [Enterococcus alishanensis]|uniref:Lipoprotein n=1 Tax=Enterococcus alishanensis TaxID=1303817 RepID=A0ABS6T9M0_9ENTE|nr:hypothetical protein [Enterococcus alishanensis]MBV7389597.1 hypothetical protein [Enterococcus alishanensis]